MVEIKTRLVLTTYFISLLISLLGSNLFSQWKEIGPCGGWITCMKSLPHDPQKMFCGILQGGAFFSNDRGENWNLIAAIGEYNPVYDLSILSDGTIYFATKHGLFLSRNSGLRWEQLLNASTWQVIALRDSAVVADTAREKYSSGTGRHPTNSSWLISHDYGQSWKFWEGTMDSSITYPDYLFAHEKRGNMIVTADDEIFRIEGLRIFKTMDENWIAWQHVNNLDPWFYASCQAFLVTDESASTYYAFAEYYDFHPGGVFDGGIFKSDDYWQSWTKLPKINSATALTLKEAYLFIGESEGVTFNSNSKLILYKTDVGSTKELGQFGGDIVAIDAETWEAGELLIAMESGIYKTTDFGATWINSSNGIRRMNAVAVQTVPINENSERIILAVHKGGIWSSENCGILWQCETTAPYVLPGILQKASNNPEFLYAGGCQIFQSSNAGNSWYEPFNYDFPAAYYGWYGRFVDLATDPFDSKHIMVHFDDHSMDDFRGILCAESFDQGTSWIERIWFSESNNYSLKAVFDTTNKRLWLSSAGTLPALMVIDSTWQEPVQTINLPAPYMVSFWCINGDTIFVMDADNAKFFRSDDLGENWFENDLGDFAYSNYWYDWAVFEHFGQLILSPDKRGIFFVYPGTGILFSKDKGITWRVLNDGLPTRNAYHLDFSTLNPNIIYLATDNGLYQFDFVTSIEWQYENEHKNYPQKFILNNFPNPFNSQTTISLFLDRPGNLTISIYSLLGQELDRLVDQQFSSAGYQWIKWKSANYTSGVFLVKVNFNENIYVKKILLLK